VGPLPETQLQQDNRVQQLGESCVLLRLQFTIFGDFDHVASMIISYQL